MKKIPNKFHPGVLTIIIFLATFAGIALKLEKVGQFMSIPLPSVATDDSKQFNA